MATTESTVLRARAAELRRIARAIETTPAIDLIMQAGDATWRGGRVTWCLTTMTGHRLALLEAARDLRSNARHFDLRADHLDMLRLGSGGPR